MHILHFMEAFISDSTKKEEESYKYDIFLWTKLHN